MARTTFVSGPGVVIFNGRTLFTKDDIKITEGMEVDEIEVAYYGGRVDERPRHRYAEVSFTPAGEFESGDFGVLYPYGSKKYGDDIFPQTDLALKVYGSDQTLRTYAAAAITKMPSLHLGTGKHPMGPVTFLCLGSGDTDWSGANSLVQVQSGQSAPTELASGDTLALADLVRTYFTGNWPATSASAPWLNFLSVDGWDIDFDLQTFDKSNDRYGLQNKGVAGVRVVAKCSPSGPTESDILAAIGFQGGTAARGMSLASLSKGDLKVEGGTTPRKLTLTVKNAAIKDYKLAYGTRTARIEEVTWAATCALLGPTMDSFFTVAIS
jgi:hypothetical protein